mmetsp:Transcript_22122/g.61533  ORF Transcript_22122/g.61533 Transcript_22122/m.61533 type:complete len:170 (+) Transcript_22122:469-978(+)
MLFTVVLYSRSNLGVAPILIVLQLKCPIPYVSYFLQLQKEQNNGGGGLDPRVHGFPSFTHSLTHSLTNSFHFFRFLHALFMYSSTRAAKVSGFSTENPLRTLLFFVANTKLRLSSASNSRPDLQAHHIMLSAMPQVFFLKKFRPSSGSVPTKILSISPIGIVLEAAVGK